MIQTSWGRRGDEVPTEMSRNGRRGRRVRDGRTGDAEQRSGRTALREDVLLLLRKDEQGRRRLRRARRL